MKKILSTLLVVTSLFTLAACSQAGSSSTANSSQSSSSAISQMPKINGITYYGEIPENPEKVVNFAYSYTGYLLELGVDVSSYSLDLEKNSPAFGDKLKDAVQLTADDTEAVAAEEPDLIIVFAGNENLETLKEIAPVIEITYGKSDYLKMLTDLGAIFGKEEKAEAWLSTWDEKVADAKEELSGVLDSDTTFTVADFFDKNIYLYGKDFGRGSELIYLALGYGAPEKVVEDVFEKDQWFNVSQEALKNYVGDYIVINVNKDTKDDATSLKESDVWKNLPAVKAGHVLEVDYDLFYFSDPMSLDLQLDAFIETVKEAKA